MQSDLFSCPVCFVPYDQDSHLPKVIPTCGHTLCSACVTQIFQKNKECPLDRIKFPDLHKKAPKPFPTNNLVIQLINEKQACEYGICLQHQKPKCLVCTVDYLMICEDCVSNHKDHNVRPIDDVKKEAQVHKKKLESVIDEITSRREEVESSVVGSKKAVLTVWKREFDKVREAVKQKEREIFNKIESVYEDKKGEIDKSLEKSDILKEKYKVKVTDLEGPMNMRYFKTLEGLAKKMPKFEPSELIKDVKVVEEEHISGLQTTSNSLIYAIEDTNFEPHTTNPTSESMEEEEEEDESSTQLQDLAQWHTLFNIEHNYDSLVVSLSCTGENKASNLDLVDLKEIETIEVRFDQGQFFLEHLEALKNIFSLCEISHLCLYFNRDPDDYPDMDEDPALNVNEWLECLSSDSSWATDRIDKFCLDLNSSFVSDDSITKFVKKALAKIQKIKTFNLNLNNTGISDESIQLLASQFISKAHFLSQINLQLYDTNITDASIIELCASLNLFAKNFTVFRLQLRKTNVTDKSITILGNAILSKMSFLQDIRLGFAETNITDLAVQSILTNLGKSKATLRSLDLNFQYIQVTDATLTHFASHILSEMKQLKFFCLNVSRTKITNPSVAALSRGLESIFKNLVTFDLNLSYNNITEEDIDTIINLTSYHPIESFCLKFEGIFVREEIRKKYANIQPLLSTKPARKSHPICPKLSPITITHCPTDNFKTNR